MPTKRYDIPTNIAIIRIADHFISVVFKIKFMSRWGRCSKKTVDICRDFDKK